MPRQLAGFRWDDHSQRYFPLHRPPQNPPLPVPVPVTPHPSLSRALSDIRSVCHTVHRDALVHHIRSSQISLTDHVVRSNLPLQGRISAFRNAPSCNFVGDTLGWLYSDADGRWHPQYNLSSEVSSIVTSPTACIATSFGPECRMIYVPLDSPTDIAHVSRIDSRTVHDVWTTNLHGSRLVLGANKQAVLIDDIALGTPLRRLPTQSDVFALAQRDNIVYTGLRNGGVIRFDTRVETSKNHLFDGIAQRKSSITALELLRDHQLLVSFLDGGISTFDLRFPVRTPSINFTGNFNSYTTRLPLATDPHEQFLFAAGQDNRIRTWSLITGGPALGSGSTDQSAFERPFEHRVAALQVVEERDGMCLWAASGFELCKYSLGRRS